MTIAIRDSSGFIKPVIEGLGFTCEAIGSSDFTVEYDCLIIAGNSGADFNVLKDFIDAGVPVMLGTYASNDFLIPFNALNVVNLDDAPDLSMLSVLTNSYLENYSFKQNVSIRSVRGYSSAYLTVTANNNLTHAICTTPDNVKNVVSYVEEGFMYGSRKAAAPFFGVGFLPFNTSSELNTNGRALLKDILNFALASKKLVFKITGNVSDSSNQPLQRLLRAFSKSSGGLVSETISAADGSYKLLVTSSEPVTVICYHDVSDTNNSQIKDDILPILDE